MTQVAAVEATSDYDYQTMLQTVKRRRRVDKAKVHRALGLLARDLDLFVSNFNSRLKALAQLTFHDAPNDIRAGSVANEPPKTKRGQRAGARVQRGRRNEAKRERGVEALPNPLFRAHEVGGSEAPRLEGQSEPPRDIAAVKRGKGKGTGHLGKEAKERRPPFARGARRPLPLVVQGGAVGASPSEVRLIKKEDGAVGARPAEAAPLVREKRTIGYVAAAEDRRAELEAA